MGFFDIITELVEAAAPWGTAQAEANAVPGGGAGEKSTPADKDQGEGEGEEAEPEADDSDKDEDEDKDKEGSGGDEEEEEEEEEEEIVDPREKLVQDCENSKNCAPSKHHFDECVERVTAAKDEKHDKKHVGEDCVEEFFHLAHCANECAAPKLWAALK